MKEAVVAILSLQLQVYLYQVMFFLRAPYCSRANWRDPLCGRSKRRAWYKPSGNHRQEGAVLSRKL